MSLLSGANSYIIGHEKERHCVEENRLNVPTSFRYIQDYRSIDSDTILSDVNEFLRRLHEAGYFNTETVDKNIVLNRPSLDTLRGKKELVGAEIGVCNGLNALNILENLDIKKLYLIDPYRLYSNQTNIGQNGTEEKNKEFKTHAHKLLDKNYSDKIVWLEKLSEDAINDIEEDLDFVYIDGNHMYDYVLNDIKLYSEKVKDGGLVAGHDFDFQHVIKAVYNFAENNNKTVESGLCKDVSKDWWYRDGNIIENIINDDIKLLNKIIRKRINTM